MGSGGVAWLWLGLRVALPLAARRTQHPPTRGPRHEARSPRFSMP
ncbi:MAG: hypothetical protein BDTLLHRC_001625, partial [Candidatus Fervidibacter sp.]